jgi:alpha-amylase
MGEWALPAEAGRELEEAKHRLQALPDGEKLGTLLRGGFWRNFLVKYPEVNDLHWAMLRLSRAIHDALARRPRDPKLLEARRHLWRCQGNDAYWHGVFGGCYLPHLRRGARQDLLEAERLLGEALKSPRLAWSRGDLNGDGLTELRLRTPTLALTLHPAAGGSVTELAYLPRALDLADVLARRPEAYHARVKAAPAQGSEEAVRTIHERLEVKEGGLSELLVYDRFRRASLLEGLFPESGDLDPLHPWDLAELTLGDQAMAHRIRSGPGRLTVVFSATHPGGWPLRVEKTVTLLERRPELHVTYRLHWKGTRRLTGRWAVQWNLALTGGDAPERYYDLPGSPALRSRGAAGDRASVGLVDEWLALTATLRWERPATLGWAPVETVSLSEAGLERIFQGSSLLLAWPFALDPGEDGEARARLTLQNRANSP